MEKTELYGILRSSNTVFTFKDILLASSGVKPNLLARKLSYYVKTGQLYAIRRGLYAKDKDYDKFELATKIFTPSYISFETVLGSAGVTFQYYSGIFVATYQSKELECDGQVYNFKKIKTPILINDAGIEKKQNYSIASPERAFLDVAYLQKDYHFDSLSALDWKKVFNILPIYGGNKRMIKKVNEYYRATKNKIL